MMNRELLEHWITIIRPLFPERAYIRALDKQVVSIIIDWRLNSNKERSYKRSRLIKIVFPKETIAQYQEQSLTERNAFDERLQKFIAHQILHFDPEHDTPRGNVPPQVEWTITNNVFFALEPS